MRTRIVAAVALAAVLLPFGASAHAATPAKRCTQYKVAGKWLFVASNNYDTTLIITQHGNKLSGPETIPADEAVNSGYSTGHFTGTIVGTKIRIIVIWAPRASDGVQLHGLYAGTVISKHIINGLATDLTTKPTPTPATWVGYGPSVCIAHAA
jgi:hypothetical protein